MSEVGSEARGGPGKFFDPADPQVAKMASLYEGRMVPVLFLPWAEELVHRVDLRPGQHVLDVACGTGAVTRVAAPLVRPGGKVTGFDFSPAMLEIARSLPIEGVEWLEGDATTLPFSDGEFDVVFCQQGLQFMPDKAASVAEMARVLKPGGRVAIACWKGEDENPVAAAISATAESVGWTEAAEGFGTPFSLGDPEVLESLLGKARFSEVNISREQRISVWPDFPGWIAEFAEVPPLAESYLSVDEPTRTEFLNGVIDRMERCSRGATHEIPWTASVAVASKPG